MKIALGGLLMAIAISPEHAAAQLLLLASKICLVSGEFKVSKSSR
jgi:hypothetical protein